jgi:hypothetical protein
MRYLIILALLLCALPIRAQENDMCDPVLQCGDQTSVTRHDDGTVTLSWHQGKPIAYQRQIWLNNTEVISKASDIPGGFYTYHDPHVRPSGTTYQIYENFPPPDDRFWSKAEIRFYLLRLPLVVK